MNLLITGIHGFVGTNLVATLKKRLFNLRIGYCVTTKRGSDQDLFME